MSSIEIIKQSIGLYRNNSKLFLQYMMLLFIPTAITTIISALAAAHFVKGIPALIGMIILFIFVYASSAWISIGFLRVMVKSYEKKPAAPIKDELKMATTLLIPSIIVSILTALIIFGGMLLLIIPGFIFAIWYSFTVYTVAIDGQKGMAALRASKSLVTGRWWSVFVRLLIPGLVFGLLLLVADGLVSTIARFIIGDAVVPQKQAIMISALLNLIATFVSLLLTPFSTGAVTILYEELKKPRSTTAV